MKVISRVKDIVVSNVNAVLDRVENPEKLVGLMVQDMEDSLVRMRASYSEAEAEHRRLRETFRDTSAKEEEWEERAWRAAKSGRDELSKEALVERRRLQRIGEETERELAELANLQSGLKKEIADMEESLREVRHKRHVLVGRHTRAWLGRRAHGILRRCESLEFRQDLKRNEDGEEGEFERAPAVRDGEESIERELRRLKNTIDEGGKQGPSG